MNTAKPSRKPILAAIIFGVILIAATTSICLLAKHGSQSSPDPSPSPEEPTKNEAQSNTVADNELNPNLCYETRFFTLQLPPDWEGRWDVQESISTRESMIDVAGYNYSFSLDGTGQFTIMCQQVNINADFVIGGADGYTVHFVDSEALTASDEFYIKQHLQLAPEE